MRPDIVVIGLGNVGLRTLWLLSNKGYTVMGIDRNGEAVARARSMGLEAKVGDATSRDSLKTLLRGVDVVATSLPGRLGLEVLKILTDMGVNVVDVSFFNPRHGEVKASRGQRILLDAGVAPGLSNLLLAMMARQYDARKGRIYVGGLSEKPMAPLGISATWNVEDLIEEYLRPARLIRQGRIAEIDPLGGEPGRLEVPGVGVMEYFPTDGLRSLINSFSHMEELVEYTLRWPGHVEAMKILRELGLMGNDTVKGNGCPIVARSCLAGLLRKRYSRVRDMLVLIVEVEGNKGKGRAHTVVHADDTWSAMAKATGGFQASATTIMEEGLIDREGVIYPEDLASMPGVAEKIIEDLEKQGIRLVFEQG